jgi:hypothetical protein
MGKGLLPWWRRRIAARGLAGAALFAVPVAVAAAIGFGTSISGLAGGLSAVTSGPGAVPASAQTSPSKLNLALVAQANRQIGSNGSASSRGGSGVRGGGGGSTGTTGTGAGSGSAGSGSGSSPVIDTSTSPPQINLPRTGGATDGVTNGVNNTANNLLGGVNNTVNGLLGGK